METVVLEEKEFFKKVYEESGMTQDNLPNMDDLYCDGYRYIRKRTLSEKHYRQEEGDTE